jgi:hypothetical protein
VVFEYFVQQSLEFLIPQFAKKPSKQSEVCIYMAPCDRAIPVVDAVSSVHIGWDTSSWLEGQVTSSLPWFAG